ncbi:hypothetical protein RIF29_34442 [Crotalaria pallida]|uniref:C3H1-type domain-containing protein n=1 Tax=Crotalaria pallida TaxID=3830 RepID=A0AAN9E982_CROPI
MNDIKHVHALIVGLRGRESNEERPTGNWDDDQKIIHKMKLCKKCCNGEECPYGEKCSFLHEDYAILNCVSSGRQQTTVPLGRIVTLLMANQLRVLGGCVEVEVAAGGIPISTYSTVPTLTKVPSIPAIDAAAVAPHCRIPSPPLANELGPGKKCLLKKWKGSKKINGIYGDWLEDMPLEQDVPSGMDT